MKRMIEAENYLLFLEGVRKEMGIEIGFIGISVSKFVSLS